MTDVIEGTMMVVGVILTVLLVAFLLGMLMAWPVMWIWNYMMPELFGVPVITYWQAFWGSFMVKLIFPSHTNYNSK